MGTVPSRRFGATGLAMPVLSLGGMRFQQSWQDVAPSDITDASQRNLDALLHRAGEHGLHHIETARFYGSSERQLGWLLPEHPDPDRILQTKVPPEADAAGFESRLRTSFERLGVRRVDLLSLHGINQPDHLEWCLGADGCVAVARRWQREGRIGHIGFSTHAPTALIIAAIESGAFAYVNLHWYYINQSNRAAIDAAMRRDMGVFIISPTDKGGHLHSPSQRLLELCRPLHPIVFNDLFCLSAPGVHTISVGAARPEDLDLHLEAVRRLPEAGDLLPPIQRRLQGERAERMGRSWLSHWRLGLPDWSSTPGQINLPVLLWLYDLWRSWDLESYVRARYGLLGNGGHWFPGANANALDEGVSEADLLAVLQASPLQHRIPTVLRELKAHFGDAGSRRLGGD
ncbi:aldo/keto reductase [Synechococcus sp. RSCCF101]|uniref:aldo/keto reductase n=1 Tax=Synechococcus sp. RSCCF101 TaxID=2511069 RepID=UPI001244AD53|nr:aldo/keto reductase [Synechococcus sp. RSCCF101]QEY33098.1 aldo/keto reductase [Synechococcus sp. RSCCF101]